MRRIGLVTAALLALAGPAAAEVISAGPDAVAVTIYRDDAIADPAAETWDGYGLAMISETRTVDLPAGETRLVLEGVADGAMPQTAALEGLPGQIAEQNFDYDLLSPGSLIEHSLGRPVQVVRTNPRTGKQTLEEAVLRSGPNGVVVDVGGQVEALGCSGDLEGLILHDVPPELTGKAALSTLIRVDRPGRYKIRLAYLAVGLAWKASYVARVAQDGASLDLTGWITLANHGDTSFATAPTSVVAGRLARQAVELARRVLAQREIACWPMGNSHHPRGEQLYLAEPEEAPAGMAMPAPPMTAKAAAGMLAEDIVVTAEKRTQLSELGDYKLYSLIEPTTVAARQTKQVLFLHQAGVQFDRVYVYRLAINTSAEGAHDQGPTVTTLRLENKPANGLGLPLPAGAVSVRQPRAAAGGGALFIGEPQLRDVAVGEPFELTTGEASDVQATWRVVSFQSFRRNGRDGERAAIEARLTNAKSQPVTGELRHIVGGAEGFKVIAETSPHGTKGGDPVWRLTVPATGEASVSYTVEYLTD